MRKIIIFISLLLLTISNLYALNTKEILEIVKDRSLKYDEVIEIINTLKGEAFFDQYYESSICVSTDIKCPNCDLDFIKILAYPLAIYNIAFSKISKLLVVAVCRNKECRECLIVYETIDIERNSLKDNVVVYNGKLSKEDYEDIKTIKNINYKTAIDLIKNFYFDDNKTRHRHTIECIYCNNKSLEITDNFDEDNGLDTIILTCTNDKCKFFSLFKRNEETNFIDYLYKGKYKKLKDVFFNDKRIIKFNI